MVPHWNRPKRAKKERAISGYSNIPGRDGKQGPEEPEEGIPQKNQKQRGSMITPTAGKEAVAEAELSLCISMNWKGEAAERAQPCQI